MSGRSLNSVLCSISAAYLLAVAAGCVSNDTQIATSANVVIDNSAPPPVAAMNAISFDEMLARGKVAMENQRFRAAVMYFGASLSARPYSTEAKQCLAEAMSAAARRKGSEEVSEFELSLPPPPMPAVTQVEEILAGMGVRDPDDEDDGIVGPSEKRGEFFGEGRTVLEGDKRSPDMIPRVPVEARGDRPRIERPTALTAVGIPSRLPCKPLRTGRNDLFHVLVHLPSFEGARTLPEKTWEIESGTDVSWGNFTKGSYGNGLFIRWQNNRYDEGYLKIAHGLTEDIEPRVELTFGNLREGDYDVYLTNNFDAYINNYDRRADLGNLLLGVKARLYRPVLEMPESGVSGEISLKVPVARNPKNFTTSGMPDIAAWLTGSWDLYRELRWPRIVAHASIGVTIPLGDQFFDREVDLDPVALFGLGACMQLDDSFAVVAQLLGNTSAFGEFSPLSTMTLTFHAGARILLGHFIIEGSVGNGLSGTSSTLTFALNVGLRVSGSQTENAITR